MDFRDLNLRGRGRYRERGGETCHSVARADPAASAPARRAVEATWPRRARCGEGREDTYPGEVNAVLGAPSLSSRRFKSALTTTNSNFYNDNFNHKTFNQSY